VGIGGYKIIENFSCLSAKRFLCLLTALQKNSHTSVTPYLQADKSHTGRDT
jgi:hypothetical protein